MDPNLYSNTAPTNPSNKIQGPVAGSSRSPSDNTTSTSKQRKHVTSACRPCKSGKVKCDGNLPCARCSSKDVICTYRSDEDGRSRVPTKRKIEQLQHDNALLHGLVDELRSADDLQVRRVVALIRSNASLTEIHDSLAQLRQYAAAGRQNSDPDPVYERSHLTAEKALSPSPPQPSSSGLSQSSESASRIMSVNRLVDEPIHRVPAAPWTSVTSDDQLASHLLSLWVTWDHLFPDGLSLEFFLRDMRSGDLESPFCSPFLVNVVLATGCLNSDYEEAKTVGHVASELCNRFIKEAKTHLEQNQFTPSITTVQGLCILYTAVCKIGHDGEGYRYAVQATAMCAELSRARERIIKAATTPQAEKEIAFVLDYTCWGAFSCTAASSTGWMRPQTLAPPKRPCPDITKVFPGFASAMWVPYPRISQPQDPHWYEVSQCHNEFALLNSEVTCMLYADKDESYSTLKAGSLHDLYIRLVSWHAELPDYMKRPYIKSPAVLLLLMWWHATILSVIRVKTQNNQPRSDSLEGNERFSEVPPTTAASGLTSDTLLLLHHALEIVDLARLHRVAYGYSCMCCAFCHPIYLALYVILEQNGERRYDEDVTELCAAMHAGSRRFPLVFSIFRMVCLDIRHKRLDLPNSAERFFVDIEIYNTAPRTKKDLPNSMYPSPHSIIRPHSGANDSATQNLHPSTMREFMEMFDNLSV